MKGDRKITRSGANNGCNCRGGLPKTSGNDIHDVRVTEYVICALGGNGVTYEDARKFPNPDARRTLQKGMPYPFTFK